MGSIKHMEGFMISKYQDVCGRIANVSGLSLDCQSWMFTICEGVAPMVIGKSLCLELCQGLCKGSVLLWNVHSY